MLSVREIESIATTILAQSQGPAIAVRLLRDVLRVPVSDNELSAAKIELNKSNYVAELASEQHPDGGWGRFHTMNYSLKRKFGTTEVAVSRAVALGLDKSHPILAKAAEYLARILRDESTFPDPPESNDRWATGEKLFTAGTLSLFDPDNPTLGETRKLWIEIANRACVGGVFDPNAERNAHKALTGATVYFRDGRETYLVLNSRYHAAILTAKPRLLNRRTEKTLLEWLWRRHDGLGYLNVPIENPPFSKPGAMDRWFTSHELLSGFTYWPEFSRDVIEILSLQRGEDGLWDFGPSPRGAGVHYFPLIENTRRKGARALDWSARTLILLYKHLSIKE